MRRSIPLLCAVVVLAACSEPSAGWTPPDPPERDPAVAAALPTGAFTVTGARTYPDGSSVNLDGFVDFGTGVDGVDCTADYTLTASFLDHPVRVVRPAGGVTWYQGSDPADPTAWTDSADPAAAGNLVSSFAPAFVAGDVSPGIAPGAGTGELCALPVMPRFMSVADDDGTTVTLAFDPERTAVAIAVARGQWVAGFVDAAGLTGTQRDEIAASTFELAVFDFTTMTAATEIRRTLDGAGGFSLVQYTDGEPVITWDFTPAAGRAVSAPDAPSFFERLTDRVAEVGVDAALAEFVS